MAVILMLLLAFGSVLSTGLPFRAAVAADSRQESSPQRRSPGGLNDIRESIRCHVEQLEEDVDLRVGRERVAFNALLAEFYRTNDFRPVWKKRSQITELLEAVGSAEGEGLMSRDYHLAEIRNFYDNPPRSPFLKARYELLLTDAMFKLSYHLLHGKVDPEKLDPNWNLSDGQNGNGLVSKLQEALAGDSLAEVIRSFRPDHPKYVSLKEGLAKYRKIATGGGWGVIADGPSIKTVGQSDERIPALRRRLEITGDMPVVKKVDTSSASSAMVYSPELQEGVRRFQNRHGLEQDGAVGPKTLRELNVPVEQRIDQIRINLDRYRWFVQKLEPTFVLVNIAGFTVQYVENGRYTWGSRVIVGKPFWKTPVFKAEMQYIIFNPSWNVPPGIMRKETLPAVRKDPGYLTRQNLRVIDRNGRVVDPYSVNWSSYSAGSLPYRISQAPGKGNALGRVKFMFPNKHLVYLHDTPGKHLFDRSERAFSHGCIRLQNPLELAQILLGWSAEDVQKMVDAGSTKTVHLTKNVPVFLLYLTAVAEGDEVLFRDDVYSRDDRVLKALNQPFPYKSIESCVF